MKKYASLLLLALFLNGCDDGDLTIETIEFADVTATSCDTTNTLLYKLKTQEALLLQLPSGDLINNPTKDGAPITYTIDDSNYRVFYRSYTGEITKSNICDAIPPSSPTVTDEWRAKAGIIQITTKADYKTPAPEDGHTEITGYTHNIIFNNITWKKPTGPDVIEPVYSFGDFKTTVTPVVVTFSDDVAEYCETYKKVYNDNTTSALVIENFDTENLIKNEDTPTGVPRKSVINLNKTTNKLYYRIYKNPLPEKTNADYFCLQTTPSTPTVSSTWVGEDGTMDVSGTIEVTTTSTTSNFKHKIVLKKVKLTKGNSTFNLANEFVLGTVTTVATTTP